jgi:hypothetical protein
MNSDVKARLVSLVRKAVELLVSGEYRALVAFAGGERLTENDITDLRESIKRYQLTLVTPPEEAFQLMDVYEVDGSTPRRWTIDMPLWTAEEGQSELTLMLTFTERGDGFDVEFGGVRPV